MHTDRETKIDGGVDRPHDQGRCGDRAIALVSPSDVANYPIIVASGPNTIGGRPPALTPDKLAVARQMHAS